MLKIDFNFNFSRRPAILFAALGWILASAAHLAHAEGDPLARLAGLVDYIAADYHAAVRGGEVVSEAEYQEQLGLARDALAIAAEVPADPAGEDARRQLGADLRRIESMLVEKADPASVTTACRAVRGALVERFGLVLAPAAPPSRERAEKLYAEACARCHGADGAADTEEAHKLDPRPAPFIDGERMARISPAHAFQTITFGVKDTGMAAFDTVPASDRWSLAYHVVGFRHPEAEARRGEQILRALPETPVAASFTRLASLTDEEIDALLAPQLPAPGDRTAVIAWLRRGAPYLPMPGGTFAVARQRLAAIGPALEQDDRRGAKELAIGAYLDGVEPHETALRARDPELARRIEIAFLELRHAVDTGEDPGAVVKRTSGLTLLLDRAEERPMGRGVAFAAALTIALREGLEAALLIAALLAFLRKSGRGDATRLVHGGWLAAVPAGLLTWWIAGALVHGAHRELVEAIITLVAAAMILSVTHWFFGRKEAQHWLGFLRRKVNDGASGGAWPLFGLAFFAAFREAFEIVLFFRALLLDAPREQGSIALGALAGTAIIVGLVLVLGRLGRRLNPRPVMLASSVLLAALAIALVGRGMRALQEGGYVAVTPLSLPDLSTIGIYPTAEGLAAQAIVLGIVLMPTLVERWRRGTTPAAATAGATNAAKSE